MYEAGGEGGGGAGPAAADEATGWLQRMSPLLRMRGGEGEQERRATAVNEATGRGVPAWTLRHRTAAWDVAMDVAARTTAGNVAPAAAVAGTRGIRGCRCG